MAVQESPQVMELNNLNAAIGRLTAEKKSLESIIKDLHEQTRLASVDMKQKISEYERQHEQRVTELHAQIAPLEHLKSQVAHYEQQVIREKQRIHDESAKLKHERIQEMARLDQLVATAAQRLEKINQVIHDCKQSVEEL